MSKSNNVSWLHLFIVWSVSLLKQNSPRIFVTWNYITGTTYFCVIFAHTNFSAKSEFVSLGNCICLENRCCEGSSIGYYIDFGMEISKDGRFIMLIRHNDKGHDSSVSSQSNNGNANLPSWRLLQTNLIMMNLSVKMSTTDKHYKSK